MSRNDKKCLYLDACTLSRPFDDQRLMRIRLEADAVLLILQHIQAGRVTMVMSPVHVREIEAIADSYERVELLSLLERFAMHPLWDMPALRVRAEQLTALKFGVADAAHLAFSEAANATFITCDDRLLKKARRLLPGLDALGPVEFCTREDLR